MTIRKILTINPDPNAQRPAILCQPAQPVTEFDDKLSELITDLIDTMKSDIICIGLAAPQIGVGLQVAIVCLDRNFNNPTIIINPTNIVESGKIDTKRETCMSLPDLCGSVKRRKNIGFDSNTINGDAVNMQFADFPARAVAHEIDHLIGVLYSDKLVGDLAPMDFDEIRKMLYSKQI